MSTWGRAGAPARAGLGAIIWFVWMVGMWAGFFALLFIGQLDNLWNAVTHLPIVVEIVAWIALFPWMLATWVWTGSWPELLRIAAVLVFAIGWTVLSIPKQWRGAI